MFGGRQLQDSTLAAAGVSDEDTLYILARLLGGGKKRKKKTYTKPKKQKHKHKKIKMRVLKFFKVRCDAWHSNVWCSVWADAVGSWSQCKLNCCLTRRWYSTQLMGQSLLPRDALRSL